MKNIHETSIVSPESIIGEDVTIGPYCMIGPHIEIDSGCRFHAHVYVEGHGKIGRNNQFYPYTTVGTPPQDINYKNEPTRIEIGENNIFREFVSIHRGTTKEGHITKIGNNSFFMSYVHIGHDVQIGDSCIFANSINFAGHVKIGDKCIFGGGSNVSQFVTIGKGCYIGGASAIDRDIPPYCSAIGNRARLKGINIIGMKRAGFPRSTISELVNFYREMESSPLSPRLFVDDEKLMMDFKHNEIVMDIKNMIKNSKLGVASFF